MEASVSAQSLCCIFGESGSGKTSLARVVAGLEGGWSGRVLSQGQTWQDSEKNILVPAHERRVGFVFQGAELFTHMSVSKNLDFAERCGAGRVEQPNRLDLVKTFELDGVLRRLPHEISGGERQRAAIAQTLLAAPTMLVMDEPMASMSKAMKDGLIPFIRRSRGSFSGPILYITHSEAELEALADSVLLLSDGRSQLFDSVTQFFAHDRVK